MMSQKESHQKKPPPPWLETNISGGWTGVRVWYAFQRTDAKKSTLDAKLACVRILKTFENKTASIDKIQKNRQMMRAKKCKLTAVQRIPIQENSSIIASCKLVVLGNCRNPVGEICCFFFRFFRTDLKGFVGICHWRCLAAVEMEWPKWIQKTVKGEMFMSTSPKQRVALGSSGVWNRDKPRGGVNTFLPEVVLSH